jgi:hypothetical protein
MRSLVIGALLAAGFGLAACDTYGGGNRPGRYGGYSYRGGDYERLGNDCHAFGGPGGAMLDPWLACTDEGRDLVRYRYGRDSERLTAAMADSLNVWFRGHADTDRDLCLTDNEIRGALVNGARFRERARG